MEKGNLDFNRNEKYITTDGEEHKKIEKQEKERKYEMPYLAFGELVIDQNLKDKIKEEINNIKDTAIRYEKMSDLIDGSELKSVRDQFSSMDPDDDFIENFAWEAVENPKIQVPFRNADLGYFLVKFSQDKEKISDSILEEMLRYHVETYRKEAEIFEEKAKEAKTDFLKYLSELIEKGDLPHLVNFNEIESKINNVNVHLEENLYSSLGSQAARVWLGFIEYNWDYRDRSDDEIKKILFHEFVHVSSGAIIEKSQSEGKDFTYKRKGGFVVNLGRREGDRRWINEGVTEMIAKMISRQAGLEDDIIESYKNEQAIIEELIEKGVPREYFIEAFFENYNEEIKGMPKWKKLIQKIHEVDSGGFLKRGKEEVKKRDDEDYEDLLNSFRQKLLNKNEK